MQPANWCREPPNKQCVYCNERLDDTSVVATKEHLIGRNFVPRGSLDGGRSFNFIFNGCRDCNNDKSALEGHISAITQFMSPVVAESDAYAERALAKSQREIHPWTKRPIVDSHHDSTIKFRGLGLGMKVTYVGPPQADHYMVNRLALRHVQGLFALVTNPDRTVEPLTLLFPGWVYVLDKYLPSDWGNSQALAAAERTRDWTVRARIVTAGGYFQAMLRRNDAEVGTWFWALEWNRYMRVIGGISYDGPPSFMRDLPDLRWVESPSPSGAILRMRQEQPLDDAKDTLFDE
jgi:hypothetical protein